MRRFVTMAKESTRIARHRAFCYSSMRMGWPMDASASGDSWRQWGRVDGSFTGVAGAMVSPTPSS